MKTTKVESNQRLIARAHKARVNNAVDYGIAHREMYFQNVTD